VKRFKEFKEKPAYEEKYHKAMTDLGGESKAGGKKHVFTHDNSELENDIHHSLKGLGYTHVPDRGEYEKRLVIGTKGGYHVVKKDTKFKGGRWQTTMTHHTEGV
jgi:hypothetical protein